VLRALRVLRVLRVLRLLEVLMSLKMVKMGIAIVGDRERREIENTSFSRLKLLAHLFVP
jgi:hypothetical protein